MPMAKKPFSKEKSNINPKLKKPPLDVDGIANAAAVKMTKDLYFAIYASVILSELVNLGIVTDDMVDVINGKTKDIATMFRQDTINFIKKAHIEQTTFDGKKSRAFVSSLWKKAATLFEINPNIIKPFLE
jgi:hypothetical protein